jgi:2-amino-4-hydroxy-6-hydroxymethyldihydropteridine diphosphokinase
VVKIETTLDPFQLLYELKIIEKDAGRTEDQIRYGPRILDLDIIFYDNIVIKSSELIIPHPKMHKRRFILKPICDIKPKFIHPVLKMDMQYLLNNLDDKEQRVIQYCFDY